jgi:hypothetical protein
MKPDPTIPSFISDEDLIRNLQDLVASLSDTVSKNRLIAHTANLNADKAQNAQNQAQRTIDRLVARVKAQGT